MSRTLLRPLLARLAITAAAGALVTAAAAVPAMADEDWGQSDPASGTSAAQHDEGGGDWADGGDWAGGGGTGGDWSQGGQQQTGQQQGNPQQTGQQQGGQQAGQQQGNPQQAGQQTGPQQGNPQQTAQQQGDPQAGQHQQQGRRDTRGVVTARELLLRSAPQRGGQVIRTVHRGDIVSIYCQTSGQPVGGNRVWYLLADGTWAWGPARYIDVIGHAPRWC
jgi:hypothetical protein